MVQILKESDYECIHDKSDYQNNMLATTNIRKSELKYRQDHEPDGTNVDEGIICLMMRLAQ